MAGNNPSSGSCCQRSFPIGPPVSSYPLKYHKLVRLKVDIALLCNIKFSMTCLASCSVVDPELLVLAICTLGFFPFVALLSFGGGGGGVAGDGGMETPAAASKDTAASALPGPAHCIPSTGKEDASSAMEDGAPEKKVLLWACH